MSAKLSASRSTTPSEPAGPDWQQGYGFQFWVCRHDAYRGDGAFGQFCVVVPGADAVIACTAQVEDMQAEIDLFWEHLLPALSGQAAASTAPPSERLSEPLARTFDRRHR